MNKRKKYYDLIIPNIELLSFSYMSGNDMQWLLRKTQSLAIDHIG